MKRCTGGACDNPMKLSSIVVAHISMPGLYNQHSNLQHCEVTSTRFSCPPKDSQNLKFQVWDSLKWIKKKHFSSLKQMFTPSNSLISSANPSPSTRPLRRNRFAIHTLSPRFPHSSLCCSFLPPSRPGRFPQSAAALLRH